jgi:hypothetical protein
MNEILTLVAPVCACCSEPAPLLPRTDLPGGLAVCAATGQFYRPDGQRYVPTTPPVLIPQLRQAQSVQIDLSRSGYA